MDGKPEIGGLNGAECYTNQSFNGDTGHIAGPVPGTIGPPDPHMAAPGNQLMQTAAASTWDSNYAKVLGFKISCNK